MKVALGFLFGVFPQSDCVVFYQRLSHAGLKTYFRDWVCFFELFIYLSVLGIWYFTQAFLWVIFPFSSPTLQEYFSSSTGFMSSHTVFANFPMFESFKIGVVTAVLYKMFEYWGSGIFRFWHIYPQCSLVRTFFVYIYTLHRPPPSSSI